MRCQKCQVQREHFIPGWERCPSCGVVDTTASETNFSYTPQYADHKYHKLTQTRERYERLVTPYLKGVYSGIERIIDLGGGFPHLALICRDPGTPIEIVDTCARLYEKKLNEYHDRITAVFPDLTNLIHSEPDEIHKTIDLPDDPTTLLSCIHFLEHLPRVEFEVMLDRINGYPGRVVIYGPDISTAREKRWVHFRCTGGNREHLTFAPAGYVIERLNRKPLWKAKTIHCDYLLVFREGFNDNIS